MRRPSILIDENIPFGAEAFATLGDVRASHGRTITREALADVDLLIVRSITTVNRRLLEGTGVGFVATATSGSDHLAVDEVEAMGVRTYTALGCNANSVAEYMAAAWLTVARRTGVLLRGRRVGIVGVGHVGSLVAQKAKALGMEPVLNDPPKARESGSSEYRPLVDLLDCDIVTCHTPLTRGGSDPTWHLIDEAFLSRMRPGAWFCNAGRGGVVDEDALHRALDRQALGACLLDVWDGEPAVDLRLVDRVGIATPHIAGYSLEGRMNGTAMVYQAACEYLGVQPVWRVEDSAPPPTVPYVAVDAAAGNDEHVLCDVISGVYPILRDDARMRRVVKLDRIAAARDFDDQRKQYPVRREFRQTTVHGGGLSGSLRATLQGLDFRL